MDSSILIILSIPIFFGLILIKFFYGVINKSNNYRINDFIASFTLAVSTFILLTSTNRDRISPA